MNMPLRLTILGDPIILKINGWIPKGSFNGCWLGECFSFPNNQYKSMYGTHIPAYPLPWTSKCNAFARAHTEAQSTCIMEMYTQQQICTHIHSEPNIRVHCNICIVQKWKCIEWILFDHLYRNILLWNVQLRKRQKKTEDEIVMLVFQFHVCQSVCLYAYRLYLCCALKWNLIQNVHFAFGLLFESSTAQVIRSKCSHRTTRWTTELALLRADSNYDMYVFHAVCALCVAVSQAARIE